MKKPSANEYHPNYQLYVDLCEDGNFFENLKRNTTAVVDFFGNIDPQKHNYRYAPQKWTVKDVFMHMIDTERGFSYRAIVCVRGDADTPLYAMNEDLYAAHVDVTNRSMDSLLDEFLTVRRGIEIVFENATVQQREFLGNGVGHPISARAIGYISIGHVIHHLKMVKERYLETKLL